MTTVQPKQRQRPVKTEAPPAGETVHVPGQSVLPLIAAIGITMIVLGSTIWWVWSAIGVVILAVSAGLWIRDVRREIEALPEEHQH